MPSIYVGLNGRCPDPVIRSQVIERIHQIARLSDLLQPVPSRESRHRAYNTVRIKTVLALRGLFPDCAGAVVDDDYLRLKHITLDGAAFAIPHNLAAHAGEHHLSIVFASVRDCPEAQGILVGVAEPDDHAARAQPRPIHTLGAQPTFHASVTSNGDQRVLEWPQIKMRNFGVEWTTRLLGFVRRYHIPDLEYAGWLAGQGWDEHYAHLDPDDTTQREIVWRDLKIGLVVEVEQTWRIEPDADALIAANVLEPAWILARFAPREVALTMAPAVRAEVGDSVAVRKALCAAAREAIVAAGKSQHLLSLGFGFRGHELVLSSSVIERRTEGGNGKKLIVTVDLAPPGLGRRAIAGHR